MEWEDHSFSGFSFTAQSTPSYIPPSNAMSNIPSSHLIEQLHGKKVSDAVVYGPKFCELFHLFCQQCALSIDIERHLFALVLDYIIPFGSWARKDLSTVEEVNNTLYNYDYLRCETRNGLIMTIVYMFSSIKATILPGMDMFGVLVSDDFGLGIANRFSLKIYNDPFGYLGFLKVSLTALIDCGALPENDRLNKSKPSIARRLDSSQLENYAKIKQRILPLLDAKRVDEAKKIVKEVADFWEFNRKRLMRGQHFTKALELIASPSEPPALEAQLPPSASLKALLPLKRVRSDELPGNEFRSQSAQEENEHDSVGPSRSAQRVAALQFTRIGMRRWSVLEYSVFDPQELLSTFSSIDSAHAFYLLDSEPPSPILQSNGVYSFSPRLSAYPCLRNALLAERVLVTEWRVSDPQLRHFLSSLTLTESRNLIQAWRSSTEGKGIARGHLAFEVDARAILCVRRSVGESKQEDLWSYVYYDDLLESYVDKSFAQLLAELFPQLSLLCAEQAHNFVVKYRPAKLCPAQLLPPFEPQAAGVETLGLLNRRAVEVLSRFQRSLDCHNVLLEAIPSSL